jgi:hypothetical protein
MNSWEIIKTELTKKSRPNTVGRNIELIQCSDLFMSLNYNLTDRDESLNAFNDDMEVRESLINRKGILELQKAGIMK